MMAAPLPYADYRLAIATNQGGIAFGFQDRDETEQAIFPLLKELSFPIPLLICPYHQDRPLNFGAYAMWRKPKSGMYLAICHLYPDILREDIIVVGDREEDEQAAEAAGLRFEKTEDFFRAIELEIRDATRDDIAEEFGLPPTGEVLSPEERAMLDDIDDEPPF